MKSVFAVFGGLVGLVMLLGAIYRWKIVPAPTPNTRIAVAVLGAGFILLAILTLTGTVFT